MASKTATEKKTVCYHCGDECDREIVEGEDRYFCCRGCLAVYRILAQNDLGSYYEFDETSGIKAPSVVIPQTKFAYLEDKTIKAKLLDFNDNNTARITLYIPQINCSSCIWLLENLYRINDGILSSQVTFLEKNVTLMFDTTRISLSSLVHLLASIGYEPTINLDNQKEAAVGKNKRKLYQKMAVAGFCFANIMLFSFPEYLSGGSPIESDLRRLFYTLNLILSLPVLLYSSNEYFISAYHGLRHKIINMDLPISLGIMMLFSRSAYEVMVMNQAGYFDSFAGLVFFLLLGKSYQQKTYNSLSFDRDYKSFFPLSVILKSRGDERSIPLTNLKVNDRIIIRNGELIPSDGILISGQGLIDYSFVTGESDLKPKETGEFIYAGGRQKGGAIEIEITKEVSQSYLVKLWNEIDIKDNKNASLVTLANKVARYFTAAIITIALGAFLYWVRFDLGMAVNAASAVLIVACPCALALSTPFTLGTLIRIFGKNQLYLRSSSIIERLANIDRVVFDKTGTLTESNNSSISFTGEKLTPDESRHLFSLCRQSAHALSIKIHNHLKTDDNYYPVEQFEEKTGQGIIGLVNNSQIIVGSTEWLREHGIKLNDKINGVKVAINGNYLGAFEFGGKYRVGIKEVLNNLRDKFKLYMISGDNDFERSKLASYLGSDSQLRFNYSPHDKLKYIKQLQESRGRVLMLGDGLNDAGALLQSDVGIAISENNSLFSPACDGIMNATAFEKLHNFVNTAGKSLTIIKVSFVISFLYNIIGVGFAVMGKITPLFSAILMPLSSITVVLFATLMTTWMARKEGLK